MWNDLELPNNLAEEVLFHGLQLSPPHPYISESEMAGRCGFVVRGRWAVKLQTLLPFSQVRNGYA